MKKKLSHNKVVIGRIVVYLLFSVGVAFNGYSIVLTHEISQHRIEKINLTLPASTLDKALWEIDAQSQFEFLYNTEDVKNEKVLSHHFKEKPLEEVLNTILKGTNMAYEIKENVVIIYKKQSNPIQQDAARSQSSKIVTGTVFDTEGESLPGATVFIKGTNTGTITDVNGSYTLNVDSEDAILVFTFMGKEPHEERVGNRSRINVRLKEASLSIGNVVVTGIFLKPKESYTGAVTTVSKTEIQQFRGQNMITTLRNIDPVMNVLSDNLMGSNPNRLPEINIRGNSSLPMSIEELNEGSSQQLNAPLVVMDGFEISLQRLMDFNDEEIESINLLKDASATAIYGSRGANGVIVITTKKPQAGKLKAYFRVGANLEIPDLSSYDLLGAFEKLELEKKVGFYDWPESPNEDYKLKELYNKRYADALRGETNWLKEPVRVGVGQKINLRLEGGSDEFRWGISASNNLISGAMKGSKRNTSNAAITLAYYQKKLIFRDQVSFGYTTTQESKYGKFSQYALLNPYLRPRDENGNIIESWEGHFMHNGATSIPNPLHDATLHTKDETATLNITNNFSLEWKVSDELNVKGQIGLSKEFYTSDYFLPASHSMFQKAAYQDESNFFRKGIYNYGTGQGFDIDGNITVSYSKSFNNKHVLYAGVYSSIAYSNSYMHLMKTEGFLNDKYNDFSNALQYAEGTTPSGTDNRSARIGVTGNINYTFDNRLFVDASFRVDGSSQFGANNRFAPFWSLGTGWNLHNESFMKNQKIFELLRLKVAYGQTGSQQFKPYQARSMYNFHNASRYMFWTGAELMGLGNENLKWQRTNQWNTGFEFRVLQGKLSGGVDFYHKLTSNLLSAIDISQDHGFKTYVENVGKVKNIGYEATIGSQILKNAKSGLLWSVTGKIAYNKNQITKLSDAIKAQTEERKVNDKNGYSKLLYEGRSQDAIYAVPSLGIDPIDGKELFVGTDGRVTKTWNPEARVYCGNAQPQYRGIISSLFSIKNIYVNMSFAYYFGGKQYNQTLIDKVEMPVNANLNVGMWQNVDRRVLKDRWQVPGDVTFFKGYSLNATKPSSRFVMNDRVFELQSVSIEYRWNTSFVKRYFNAETINFSANMSDVFRLSSIKREAGTEYPYARNIQFTVSMLF